MGTSGPEPMGSVHLRRRVRAGPGSHQRPVPRETVSGLGVLGLHWGLKGRRKEPCRRGGGPGLTLRSSGVRTRGRTALGAQRPRKSQVWPWRTALLHRPRCSRTVLPAPRGPRPQPGDSGHQARGQASGGPHQCSPERFQGEPSGQRAAEKGCPWALGPVRQEKRKPSKHASPHQAGRASGTIDRPIWGVSFDYVCAAWATSLIKGRLQGLLAGGACPRPLHGGRRVSCVASESIKGERGGSLRELPTPQLEGPCSHRPPTPPRRWVPRPQMGPLASEQCRRGAGMGKLCRDLSGSN